MTNKLTPTEADREVLIARLSKRAADDRSYAENNTIVASMLQPQMDAFDRRDGTHNLYAVRLQLDHRNSAKKDMQFADDLEMAIALIRKDAL